MFWNQISKEILDKLKDKILSWQLKSGFFLLSWPKNIWKKTLVLELIKQLWVLESDLLMIEDPSKIDWGNYTIKVDVPEKEQKMIVQDKVFLNLWARQINEFISTTAFWKYKVVFIENIERLNISAANSLLKTLEEPSEWVFIFATTSNKNKLLDTIISRAILINFYPVSYEEFEKFLSDAWFDLTSNKKKLLYAISWARIGLAKKLLSENDQILNKIEEYLELENSGIWWRFSLLKDMIQSEDIYYFIDGLIFYYTHTEDFEKVMALINLKQKEQANVNLENLLFDFVLNN